MDLATDIIVTNQPPAPVIGHIRRKLPPIIVEISFNMKNMITGIQNKLFVHIICNMSVKHYLCIVMILNSFTEKTSLNQERIV